MPINEGSFIGLDGTTFIRHVHAAAAGYPSVDLDEDQVAFLVYFVGIIK
jgi:hypothetical protein